MKIHCHFSFQLAQLLAELNSIPDLFPVKTPTSTPSVSISEKGLTKRFKALLKVCALVSVSTRCHFIFFTVLLYCLLVMHFILQFWHTVKSTLHPLSGTHTCRNCVFPSFPLQWLGKDYIVSCVSLKGKVTAYGTPSDLTIWMYELFIKAGMEWIKGITIKKEKNRKKSLHVT